MLESTTEPMQEDLQSSGSISSSSSSAGLQIQPLQLPVVAIPISSSSPNTNFPLSVPLQPPTPAIVPTFTPSSQFSSSGRTNFQRRQTSTFTAPRRINSSNFNQQKNLKQKNTNFLQPLKSSSKKRQLLDSEIEKLSSRGIGKMSMPRSASGGETKTDIEFVPQKKKQKISKTKKCDVKIMWQNSYIQCAVSKNMTFSDFAKEIGCEFKDLQDSVVVLQNGNVN